MGILPFQEHQVFSIDLTADIRFKQQYFVYPKRKFNAGNKGPDVSIRYRFVNGIDNDIRMQSLSISLSDIHSFGGYGYSRYFIEGGAVIDKNDLEFIDYKHFNGNQFVISEPGNYYNSFLMLPYYSHSTDGRFFPSALRTQFQWFHIG